jgi:hypothetical protein
VPTSSVLTDFHTSIFEGILTECRCVNRITDTSPSDIDLFDCRFNALRVYGETLGHCNVSRSCKIPHPDGRELKIGSTSNNNGRI